jgi:hypothetical protein
MLPEAGYYRYIAVLAVAAFIISLMKVFAVLFAIIDELLFDQDDNTFY